MPASICFSEPNDVFVPGLVVGRPAGSAWPDCGTAESIRPSWMAATVGAIVRKKRRRSWLISSDIHLSRLARGSKLRQAAIDDHFRSCNEGGIVTCEEHCCLGDLHGLSETMQRALILGRRRGFVELLLGKSELGTKLSADRARAYGIDANAAGCKLGTQRPGQ